MEINDTTRTFPRTLNEAFPSTLENGAAIEIPSDTMPLVDKVMIAVSLVAFAVVILDIFVWGTK
jgi:hypothetical protein